MPLMRFCQLIFLLLVTAPVCSARQAPPKPPTTPIPKATKAEGRKALAAKLFAEAARNFEEALKRMPNHPEATKLLKQAREGRP